MNSEISFPFPLAAQPRVKRRVPLFQNLILGLLLSLTIPAALVLGLLAVFEAAHLVLPGVFVAGQPVGSQSLAQLQSQLDTTWNVQATLTLSDGQRRWAARPMEYGLYLDPAATAAAAYAAGRANALEELSQILLRQPRSVEPVVVFNPARARAGLEQIAKELYRAPRDAQLQFAGGQWSATPGQPGQALNLAATLAQIQESPWRTLLSGQIQLLVTPLAPQVSDLTPLAGVYQTLANRPLKLRAYDPISDETSTWSLPPEQLARYIQVVDPLATPPQLRLAGEALDDALARWQPETLGAGRVFAEIQGRERLSEIWQQGGELFALIRRLPTRYTVQRGDTIYSIAARVGLPAWRIEKANPQTPSGSLSVGQVLIIPSKNDLLPLPVVMGKRIVISTSKQHMWVYEGGKLRSEHIISSGIASSPTLAGVFQVTDHILNAYAERWDLWMPHWLTIYEAVPGFSNGIHGLPLMHSGLRLWGNVLGKPASYGCIIMSLKEAEDLYRWAENGTVVEIKP